MLRNRFHPITTLLIALNLFLAVLASKHNFDTQTLLSWGAMNEHMPTVQTLSQLPPFNTLTNHGQSWLNTPIKGVNLLLLRAIEASFLHFSWSHAISNLLVLLFVGRMFESSNYPLLLLPTYLITGIFSMLCALFIQPHAVTAGASGAIFGIMAAIITIGLRAEHAYNNNRLSRYQYEAYVGNKTVTWSLVIYNIIASFIFPGVSIVGHLAGLTAGIILGLIIPLKKY